MAALIPSAAPELPSLPSSLPSLARAALAPFLLMVRPDVTGNPLLGGLTASGGTLFVVVAGFATLDGGFDKAPVAPLAFTPAPRQCQQRVV